MATYVLMFVNDESFRDRSKDEVAEVYADITRWSEDLERKGVLKGGVELQPTRTATTVRRVNGTMRVSDGPFVESKEHVGGFAMIEVPDLDEAIRIAKTFPGGVEVRPIVVHGAPRSRARRWRRTSTRRHAGPRRGPFRTLITP